MSASGADRDKSIRRALPDEQPPAATLSPWLRLMLAEIARKREDLEQARAEEQRRVSESESNSAHRHYSVGP
jgi:hypothetical protein